MQDSLHSNSVLMNIVFIFIFLLQEAVPSHVASAGTLAVAFMETLSTVLQSFSNGYRQGSFLILPSPYVFLIDTFLTLNVVNKNIPT